MDIKALIRGYLAREKMLHLATIGADGKPWVCNVWFAADDALNLYWFSGVNRRHSAEVARNPHVAGGIVFAQTPADSPRGLQFEGTTFKLTDPTSIKTATELFTDRIFPVEKIQAFRNNPANPHDFYRIKVKQYVLFDTVNFPDAPRQAWSPHA